MFISENNKLNDRVRKIDCSYEVYSNSKQDVDGVLTKDYRIGLVKEITIERNGDNTKFFGYGIVQKFNGKFIHPVNSSSIDAVPTYTAIKVKFKSSNYEQYFDKFPYYFVTETHIDDTTKNSSVTAYDALYFSNLKKFSDLTSLKAPYTIGDVASAIATKLGLKGYQTRYPQKSDTTNTFELLNPQGANYDGDETLREVLDDIAEATQTFYYIEGETLIFKQFGYNGENAITLTRDDYFDFKFKGKRRLSRIVSATTLGDNVESNPPEGEVHQVESTLTGSTQYIRDNGFWTLRKDIDTILESAKSRVLDDRISEFTLETRGNYLYEIGDFFYIQSRNLNVDKNVYVTCCLLNDTLTYDGGLTQTISWEYQDNDTEDAANPATLGEALNKTFAIVDKVNKQIKLVVSQVNENTKKLASIDIDPDTINALVSRVEENSNNIASLRMDSDSIFNSVQQIQKNVDASLEGMNGQIDELRKQVSLGITADDVKIEVSKQLTQGVNTVTTSTGFTFNQDGLTIDKNTSDISTQITEDGMKIMKNNNALLTADHGGVKAQNLHATTYLIIGDNSRFEDYDNGSRTGCFWIGY